jgi:tRNA1(Val) A37 N6-methylase TrmN6
MVTTKELGTNELLCYHHGYSGGPELDAVLQTLEITAADSVLDIGSGKGGALLTMARHPFATADGVEISPVLVEIAHRNLRRMGISKTSVTCCDAAEFTELDRYTFLYMNNPFPRIVMERVMRNVCESVQRRPRRLILIYRTPESDEVVKAAGFRIFKVSQPFNCYVRSC